MPIDTCVSEQSQSRQYTQDVCRITGIEAVNKILFENPFAFRREGYEKVGKGLYETRGYAPNTLAAVHACARRDFTFANDDVEFEVGEYSAGVQGAYLGEYMPTWRGQPIPP